MVDGRRPYWVDKRGVKGGRIRDSNLGPRTRVARQGVHHHPAVAHADPLQPAGLVAADPAAASRAATNSCLAAAGRRSSPASSGWRNPPAAHRGSAANGGRRGPLPVGLCRGPWPISRGSAAIDTGKGRSRTCARRAAASPAPAWTAPMRPVDHRLATSQPTPAGSTCSHSVPRAGSVPTSALPAGTAPCARSAAGSAADCGAGGWTGRSYRPSRARGSAAPTAPRGVADLKPLGRPP
jgi:hypothetical protein